MPSHAFIYGKNFTLALAFSIVFGAGSDFQIVIGPDGKHIVIGPGDPGPIEKKFGPVLAKLQAAVLEVERVAASHANPVTHAAVAS